MGVTVKDVAKLAGVSTATVSRVINDDSRISQATKKNVLDCIEKLDYKVNNIARSLKTNKTLIIGFICPELTNDFFMNIARGVEDELKKNGYSMIICNSNENVQEEESRIDLLCEKCVDGIISIPVSNEGKHYQKAKDKSISIVLADRILDDFATDAVLVDNINGSYGVIEYLITHGCRRIGFIGGDMRTTSARERYEGYLRAFRDYRIPIDEKIIKFGDFHVQSGYGLMKELMEMVEPPELVFVSNSFMHTGAAKYILESGMKLDKKELLAGFDHVELTAVLGLSRVSVQQPMAEIGSKAASILLSRIRNESFAFPQIIRMKTTMIIGS